jgi:hypothetical protein
LPKREPEQCCLFENRHNDRTISKRLLGEVVGFLAAEFVWCPVNGLQSSDIPAPD